MADATRLITVACVLRSGGDFRVEHVAALRDRTKKYPHRFVCLTDIPADVEAAGIEAIPFPPGFLWPIWWGKICLFQLLMPPVFYMDLDTIPFGDLEVLFDRQHRFTMLETFRYPGGRSSGVMAWSEDLSEIYRKFMTAPDHFAMEYRTDEKWGDQGFIFDHTPVKPETWQELYPGMIVGYKEHVLPPGDDYRAYIGARGLCTRPENEVVPPDARIICFYGHPRPWNTSLWERL